MPAPKPLSGVNRLVLNDSEAKKESLSTLNSRLLKANEEAKKIKEIPKKGKK